MFELGKPKPVTERAAEGESERIYHEIRQTLRITGVNLNFRTWAGYENFFPAMWEALRPNVETRAFENAADEVRAAAVREAVALGKLDAAARAQLGESQAYQVRAALALYHYINPKLLVFTAAVKLALDGEQTGQAGIDAELIERGVPTKMYAMEMIEEEPDDERLRTVFEDIKQTLSLSSINSDYRTLALWPDYLIAAWDDLKPITQQDEYRQASDRLRETARRYAQALPYAVPLSREQVEALGDDADEVARTTEKFERLLPSLILNIALFSLDWQSADALVQSPFPAAPSRQVEGGGAQ